MRACRYTIIHTTPSNIRRSTVGWVCVRRCFYVRYIFSPSSLRHHWFQIILSWIRRFLLSHHHIFEFVHSPFVGSFQQKRTTNRSHQLIFNDERQTSIYAIIDIYIYIPYSLDSFVLLMYLLLFSWIDCNKVLFLWDSKIYFHVFF